MKCTEMRVFYFSVIVSVLIASCFLLVATDVTAQTKRCSPNPDNDQCDSQETFLLIMKPYKCSEKFYSSALGKCIGGNSVEGKCENELEECKNCVCRPEIYLADGDMCRCMLSD